MKPSQRAPLSLQARPRGARFSRLAQLFALVAAGPMLFFLSSLAALALHPAQPAVEPHRLFETLARALVAAGEDVMALHQQQQLLNGSSSASTLSTGRYGDGSAELHTVADAASSRLLQQALQSFPGLSVVNEEEVLSGAQSWEPTHRGSKAKGFWGWLGGSSSSSLQVAGPGSVRRGAGSASSASGAGSGAGSGGAPGSASGAALARPAPLPLSELSVFLDPLDATAEYSEGLLQFVSLSACITRCGSPIAALTYLPQQRRLYWTRPGAGLNVAFDAGSGPGQRCGLGRGAWQLWPLLPSAAPWGPQAR
jgi:3'-phosphoadenosine 5'-phosphosulfate (PAPS) 3'-phosphatase